MEGVSLPSACVHVLGRVCQIDDDDDCVCVCACVRACVRVCVLEKKGYSKKWNQCAVQLCINVCAVC